MPSHDENSMPDVSQPGRLQEQYIDSLLRGLPIEELVDPTWEFRAAARSGELPAILTKRQDGNFDLKYRDYPDIIVPPLSESELGCKLSQPNNFSDKFLSYLSKHGFFIKPNNWKRNWEPPKDLIA